jgi:hypothetical protein
MGSARCTIRIVAEASGRSVAITDLPRKRSTIMQLGPVEYAVVAFPGSQFTGEIAPALADLIEAGTVRVIDLAFVTKDLDGTAHAAELTELAADVQAVFDAAGVSVNGLLNDEDLMAAANSLDPGSSAALIVWEDLWAKTFAEAVRNAQGVLIERRTIPHDVAQAAHDYAVSVGADLLAAE